MQAPQSQMKRSVEFATFMRAYQDVVFSTAARLTGNEAQAQDIAQEVFLKAYENFEQLCASSTRGGWLKTVATNLSLNYLSRYRKRWQFFSEFRRADQDVDEPDVEFVAPEELLTGMHEEERRVVVERSLKSLPEHQRVPLVLYHFEDLSYEEIAARLRISLSKVKTDIRRGRVALAQMFAHTDSARDHLDD